MSSNFAKILQGFACGTCCLLLLRGDTSLIITVHYLSLVLKVLGVSSGYYFNTGNINVYPQIVFPRYPIVTVFIVVFCHYPLLLLQVLFQPSLGYQQDLAD